MRKQTKIAAVVSAAALLALGASITSFAASKGTWMMTDGEWYCYDKNGDVYTNTFCSSNGKEYYVGDDGAIVTSSWVEYDGDYYFVNSSGAKVTNDWRLTAPVDDENGEEQWFYFQSSGKRANNKKVLYNGKTYYFDADGKMLTGWVTANGTDVVNEENEINTSYTFYCDETGARVEDKWVYTTAPATADDDADADEYWYYLKKGSGKVATGKQNNLKGQSYIFGNVPGSNMGQLLTGWVAKDDADGLYREVGGEGSTYAIGDDEVVYYAPYGGDFDGHVKKNQWVKTWRPENAYDEDEDVDKYYYYLEKDGKVYIPDGAIAAGYRYGLGDGAMALKAGQFNISKKKISSKDYFFNENGEMLYGFIKVVAVAQGSNGLEKGMYYLGTSSDGSMKTGAITAKDENGDVYKFYFETSAAHKGVGITGNKNNKLYYEGHLVAANDYKYQPVAFDTTGNGTVDSIFIVNQNGSIQHSNVEYKEDGDVLIDAKNYAATTTKPASVVKFFANGTYKYAIDVANSNDVYDRITVDFVNPEDIMAISGTGFISSESNFTPANAQ